MATNNPLKEKIYRIIFKTDTPAGIGFDVLLIIAIILSILFVMLESVEHIDKQYHDFFFIMEVILTVFFTIEYILRVWCVEKRSKYIFSFFGIVDLLAILPTYLSIIFPPTHYLMITRTFRLLRIFRILKLMRFVGEGRLLLNALRASRAKIIVFLMALLNIALIMGTIMYIIEGKENGFTSIPRSIYWAIVTITTVGYGDLSPNTSLGQAVAAFLMILGYAVIAVPTGIVSSEISKLEGEIEDLEKVICKSCELDEHDDDALHCKYCGEEL